MFLKNRSAVIKQSLLEVRIAEDPLSYMRAILRIAFGNLSDVANDFQRLFSADPGCCAGNPTPLDNLLNKPC